MHFRPTEPGFVGQVPVQEPTRHAGETPTRFRRPMRELLSTTPPYDSDWVLAFLGARALPGVERVTGATWERATLSQGRPVLVRVHAVTDGLEVESTTPLDGATRARLDRL